MVKKPNEREAERIENCNAKAWEQVERGNIEGAVEIYTAELAKGKHAQLLSNRASLWNRLKESDKAIADFSEAIRLDPTFAVAYLNRGTAYQHKGEEAAALADFHQAVALNPAFRNRIPRLEFNREELHSHFEKGCALHDQGKLQDAIAAYTAAIACNPGYPKPYANRAAAFQELNRLEEAISGFTEALQADPTLALAYQQRGICAAQLDKNDMALADFTKAIDMEPTPYHYYLRAILLESTDKSMALKDLQAALALAPETWPYRAECEERAKRANPKI